MSIFLLSAFASAALFVGLPLGRVQGVTIERQRFLLGGSSGFLLYLLLDLLGHANELPLETLTAARQGEAPWGLALAGWASFLGGLVAGWAVGQGGYRWWMRRQGGRDQVEAHPAQALLGSIQARSLSLLLATSLGLYNFAQGMAIGQAGRYTVLSAVNERGAAVTLLLLGFLLHNGAKGLVVVTPLLAARSSFAWQALLALGTVAGLPTLLGTLFGGTYWNPYLFVSFLTMPAGVIGVTLQQLLGITKGGRSALWGGVSGFLLALVVTFVLEVGQYSLPELMSSYWL